jgi:hypothetical protein
MLNKDNVITNWNKKATEMIDTKFELGGELSKIKALDRERLREGLHQCRKDKKTVTVNSISFKNKNNERFLTDISNIPLINENGELQGIVMVINDSTNIINMQTEIKRKQEEFEKLNNQFQDTYTKLKLANIEKKSEEKLTAKSEFQLTAEKNISTKKEIENNLVKEPNITSESNNVSIHLDEKKSSIADVISDFEKKIECNDPNDKEDRSWKEKIKIYNEIDKKLGHEEESIKTKKLEEDDVD